MTVPSQRRWRWLAAECFEALVQEPRALLLLASGRQEELTTAIIESRTLRSTPESGTGIGCCLASPALVGTRQDIG